MAESPDHSSAATADAAASLYCAEDVDNVVNSDSDTPDDAEDVVSWDSDAWISDPGSSSLIYADCPPFDESTIDRLFGSEEDHRPVEDYLCRCRDRSVDVTSRQDSINWILKVGVCVVKYGNVKVCLERIGDFGRCRCMHTITSDRLRRFSPLTTWTVFSPVMLFRYYRNSQSFTPSGAF